LQGESLVATWNKHWPAGTPCSVVKDLGEVVETRTRSHAWTLGHGAAVVLLEGISGGYALERVIPHGPAAAPEGTR
jgi:hypothetical protein